MMKRRNISMPEVLWAKLRVRAATEHTSTSALIRRAVITMLEETE